MSHVTQARGRTHITFIGAGTMACAILDGLSKSLPSTLELGQKSEYSISIAVRRQEQALQLSERYPGAYITNNNDDHKLWKLAQDDKLSAHIILICTKPQPTVDVCANIRLAYEKVSLPCILPIVVTMCPGITITMLESWLTMQNQPKPFTVIRTMPNTPVSIRQGATALIASAHATTAEIDRVISLFRVFSPCVEILPEESLLDVAAAVSGYISCFETLFARI
jgi:pyrroline-5-carboxylate reductase